MNLKRFDISISQIICVQRPVDPPNVFLVNTPKFEARVGEECQNRTFRRTYADTHTLLCGFLCEDLQWFCRAAFHTFLSSRTAVTWTEDEVIFFFFIAQLHVMKLCLALQHSPLLLSSLAPPPPPL